MQYGGLTTLGVEGIRKLKALWNKAWFYDGERTAIPDPAVITSILSAMEAAPTGGNSMSVEYTVIDDINRVDEIWQEAFHYSL